MGIAHVDEAPVREYQLGHLRGKWTMVGNAAGCVKAGVRRIELPVGAWSTPAHEHGREEEIFYVLSGRGLSWQGGGVTEVRAGDCIVYLPNAGAHTVHALEPLDLLAFGMREDDESVGFPRLGMSYVGRRMVDSIPGVTNGAPTQFVRESALGPPPLPPGSTVAPAGAGSSRVAAGGAASADAASVSGASKSGASIGGASIGGVSDTAASISGASISGVSDMAASISGAPGAAELRPPTIVNLEDVEAVTVERPRVARTRRNLGRAAGSRATGLQHVVVMPGKESAPPHCHSLEEEIFMILDGDGVVVLGEEETPVRPGHVVARPAGTGVAHMFRAGTGGLTYLAYGLRESADVCYYPRSGKIAFRGVGLIGRIERLDYWDGED